MTAHDHPTFVPGCYRCDLSRDETADRIETARRITLPVDDARTAWEREALRRFLASSADIPTHVMKDFEVALWGACHVLRLMRPDVPAAGEDPKVRVMNGLRVRLPGDARRRATAVAAVDRRIALLAARRVAPAAVLRGEVQP